jgi:hypothetical protein
MTSLADLLNPTFLVFLGILVLVVAFLILYFESKLREQNHKIASMLSLVSTLAEDMNGVKMGLNHLSIRGGQGFEQPIVPIQENLGNLQKNNLIDVSDDDEEDEDDYDEDDEASESQGSNDVINDDLDSIEKDLDSVDLDSVEDDLDSIEDDLDSIEDDLDSIEDDLDSENGENIKIVTLQVSNENIDETNEEIHNLDFDNEYSADLDDEFEPEVNNEYVEEVLDLKYNTEAKTLEENNIAEKSSKEIIVPTLELKSISINLEEEHEQSHNDNIDYKKLQIAKLRSIAIERGLVSNTEASKLKKPELLKLFDFE